MTFKPVPAILIREAAIKQEIGCGMVIKNLKSNSGGSSDDFIGELLRQYGGGYATSSIGKHQIIWIKNKPDLMHLESIINKIQNIYSGSDVSCFDVSKELKEFSGALMGCLDSSGVDANLSGLANHLSVIDFSKAIKKLPIECYNPLNKTLEKYGEYWDVADSLLLGKIGFKESDIRKKYLLSYIRKVIAKWISSEFSKSFSGKVFVNSHLLSSQQLLQDQLVPVLPFSDYKITSPSLYSQYALKLPLNSLKHININFQMPLILDFYPGDFIPDFNLNAATDVIVWNHDYHDGIANWGIKQGIKYYINPRGTLG